MIDIHCHILHGIDDGPENIEESIKLLQMATDNNIDQIVLTPHIHNFNDINEFISKRDNKIAELNQIKDEKEIQVKLFSGAEVCINDDIFYTSELNKLTINHSKYILAEFQYSDINEKRFVRYIDEIMSHELIPIIAHPERYQYFQRNFDFIECIAQKGALFQINAASLLGIDGKAECKLSKELLFREYASFIASDSHSFHRRPNSVMNSCLQLFQNVDPHYLNTITNFNPSCVINNSNLYDDI